VTGVAPPPDPRTVLLGPDHPLVAGRTGRGVAVAVIDSGVHPTHPHIRSAGLGRLLAIAPDCTESADAVDRLGHGTAVAAAIQDKAPDAELHVIRVFHDRLSTTAAALVRAIERAVELDARLINLSLGTTAAAHAPALAAAVARARAAGVIVVAAREHAGAACFPGSLPGVAGVLLDSGCPRQAVHFAEGVFRASGQPRPISGVRPERNLQGISFAVANVTGVLARILEGLPTVRRLPELEAAIGGGHDQQRNAG
jgi:subtilisin family serine protease